MSGDSATVVTIVAIVLLASAIPVAWLLADTRAAMATADRQEDLVDNVVPTRQAPSDYDGDGLVDDRDRCPTRPETSNGFLDEDGCPDVVATTGAS